ncbi:sigma-70 family RNA polymerase sigma factor [Phycisphaeraceae bacterium D3-23]
MPDPAQQRNLTVLWMKAQPAVSAYLHSIIFDRHHAEDLLQQTAMHCTDKFEQYDPARPFTAWAMGMARLNALHYMRTRGRDRHRFGDDLLASLAQAQVAVHEEEGTAMADALRLCLADLPKHNRRMVELRHLRGMSPPDIGQKIGKTGNSVAVTLHRIRKGLGKCITQRIDDAGPAGE